ncbi:MAG: cold shock domain-containing protein [Bacteroidia bacterium]|nr:cold shock domain-containing protein [Bacteroidia bacterium]
MGRSQETFSKKEKEKKKQKKREDKERKREDRKANFVAGKSLEDMLAYVDENGVITDTPPDPSKRKKIKAEDIIIGVPKMEDMEPEDPIKEGRVTHFNSDKGYGFIRPQDSQDSIFFHVNNTLDDVQMNDKVTFEIQMGPKGAAAVAVKLAE